jgi:carbon-monoxide dehydrogenase large subunit
MKTRAPKRPALAHGKVRYVGEGVALVVAESLHAAQDAAELIEVGYRDLPAVVQPEAALAPGAPQLHGDVPGNMPLETEAGNAAAVDAAFAGAAHVTRLKMEVSRVAPRPMEPRACTVVYDADAAVTRCTCSQGYTTMRTQLRSTPACRTTN